MPEMHFRVRWPNGTVENCYSPSYVIEDHLEVGRGYSVPDFVARSSTALNIASERVRAKFGFACSSALDQLGAIEQRAAELGAEQSKDEVFVLAFTKHGASEAESSRRSSEYFPVVVIGGGQAGLSVSYLLKERNIEHVVLEKRRVAHAWRSERWDTFCLVTPNWQCRLPGHPYTGDEPEGFMQRDEIVEYVESYARRFELPVREGVSVECVQQRASGAGPRFHILTSQGSFVASQVVVATGGYHGPRLPKFSQQLPAAVKQLHSSEYRNAAQLPEGAVLVVGTGQSGCQIAEDLHLSGRTVHLCVGNAPRCARRYRGRDVVEWLELMGHYETPIDQHPSAEQLRERANHYVTGRDGGRDIDLRQFALEGMRLYGRLTSVDASGLSFSPELKRNLDAADAVYRSINRAIDVHIDKFSIDAPAEADYTAPWEPEAEPVALNLAEQNVTSVVWSTGFVSDYGWLELGVFDERGRVQHTRGVTAIPGLYFIGLPWLHTWGSGRFSGVAQDARYLCENIATRALTPSATGSSQAPSAVPLAPTRTPVRDAIQGGE